MIKKIIALIICMWMIFALVACGPQESDNVLPTENTSETEDSTQQITDPTVEEQEPIKIDVQSVVIEKDDLEVWEKEYQAFQMSDLIVTKDWPSYISLSGVKIKTDVCTEMSKLKNNFFETDYHVPIEEVYNVRMLKGNVSGPQIDISKYITLNLTILASTFVQDDKNYAIVDEVLVNSYINVYEVDTSKFANPEDGVMIGSTLKHLTQILGAPTEQHVGSNGMGGATVLYVYQSANTRLSFTMLATDENNLDNALITAIKWEPLAVQAMLQNQKHWH